MFSEFIIAVALLEEGATKRFVGTFDLPKEPPLPKGPPVLKKVLKESPPEQHSLRGGLKSIFSREIANRPVRRQRRIFPFLNLPAELRMMIYQHYATLVHRPYETHVRCRSRIRTGNWDHPELSSYSKKQAKYKRNLLLINRQIYREAAGLIYRLPIQLHTPRCIFYDLNRNLIEAAKLLPSFTAKYPVEHLTLVLGQGPFAMDTFDFGVYRTKFVEFFRLLPGLKRLEIIVATRHTTWYPYLVGCIREGIGVCLEVAPPGLIISFRDDDFGRCGQYKGYIGSPLDECFTVQVLSTKLLENLLEVEIEERAAKT